MFTAVISFYMYNKAASNIYYILFIKLLHTKT